MSGPFAETEVGCLPAIVAVDDVGRRGVPPAGSRAEREPRFNPA